MVALGVNGDTRRSRCSRRSLTVFTYDGRSGGSADFPGTGTTCSGARTNSAASAASSGISPDVRREPTWVRACRPRSACSRASDPIVLTEVVAPAGRPEVSLQRPHARCASIFQTRSPRSACASASSFCRPASSCSASTSASCAPNSFPARSRSRSDFRRRRTRAADRCRASGWSTPPGGYAADFALEAGALLEVTLPRATRTVRLDVDGRRTRDRRRSARRRPAASWHRKAASAIRAGRADIELRAAREFTRLRVRTPSGLILLHRLCWTRPARAVSIPVTAYDGPMVVGRATLSGLPGDVVEPRMTFDRITAVEIGGGAAASSISARRSCRTSRSRTGGPSQIVRSRCCSR